MNKYVLSIDPASNLCGVSLWKNGSYYTSTVLKSRNSRDPFSIRMQTICTDLATFLDLHIKDEKIETVVSESVRSRLVSLCLGSIIVSPYIVANIKPNETFIVPSQWKAYCKRHGATGPTKDIKGVKALIEIGWDMKKHPVMSQDEADSILIYLTWKELYDR